MARQSMHTRQQIDGEYQAAMTDAMAALETTLGEAADRLHAAMENAYAYYQRRVSLAHRRYWQASDLARETRDQALPWAVAVTALGKQERKAITNGRAS